MKERFSGHAALVTGAGSGIGAGIAAALAAQGARVIVSDVEGAAAARIAQQIGANALPLRLDVTSEADWAAAMEFARAELGGLSILIANAGISVGGSIEDVSFARWRQAFAVHADGAFLGMQAALPLLREQASAAIVAIASMAAEAARGDMAAYGASKAALVSLTRSVALHCAAKGWPVRANCVMPAYVDTPMLDRIAPAMEREALVARLAKQVPQGRIGAVADVVEAALYLASDAARFVTATEIRVDGGMSAR